MTDDKTVWFEIPRRSLDANGIFQVGQILTDALNPESALFRAGPFRGLKPDTLSLIIRSRSSLSVKYGEIGNVELITNYSSAIDGARVDGKGNFVRWQWLQTECIIRNDAFLKAVIQEDEVKKYLSSENPYRDLLLVTEVIKVQEIIPKGVGYNSESFCGPHISSYFPTSSRTSAIPIDQAFSQEAGTPFSTYSNALTGQLGDKQYTLPADFKGPKNGKPFIWKYKLERLSHPEKTDSISSKRYYPSEALSNAKKQNWIEILLGLLFGWITYIPFQLDRGVGKSSNFRVVKDSHEMPTRPESLSWSRVIDDPTITTVEASNTSVPGRDIHNTGRFLSPQPRSSFTRRNSWDRAQVMRNGTDHDDANAGNAKSTPFSQSVPNYDLPPTLALSNNESYLRHSVSDSEVNFLVRDNPKCQGCKKFTEQFEPELAEHQQTIKISSLPTMATTISIQQDNTQAIQPEGERSFHAPDVPEILGTGKLAKFTSAAAADSVTSGSVAANEEYVFDSEVEGLAKCLSEDKAIPLADEWFSSHIKRVDKYFDSYRSGRPNEIVKIAVLDTGLDMNHLLLRDYKDREQIAQEDSIDFTKPDAGPVTGDRIGHGTFCTHLILKTCRTAKIYVAKVFNNATADYETAACVAKASC
ncbi:uncharacterized protein TrAFT101_005742 [Trichoderma asperellum]|uniref:uncharacterized protein n=1 Tax=Trichoderma asperellum TaxID=101201 RepID=UPI0033259403|nr:hypothetical protein TrAFT101_005742 [Trichoderma asperellum]